MSHAAPTRALVRTARTATLATLAREPAGHPFASLVSVADDGEGRPLLLLSRLAEHTRNLLARAEASILFVEEAPAGTDPLALERATLVGRCQPIPDEDSAAARARYLAAHPEAEPYFGFGDFTLYRLEVESARFVGGFGRMSWVDAADYRSTSD